MKPINSECAFGFDELFFSTTTKTGVITHGNRVFVRISGFEEEQLIGFAHSVVRHPDMPRSVFKLFWDTLKSNRSIAAYVKNMAADGRYYWVLAVASPIDSGYLSIRLKPSSPVFDAVQRIYQQVLHVEQKCAEEGGDRPAQIAAGTVELHQKLAELGFNDYESFMFHALNVEMQQRQEKLKNDVHHVKRTRFRIPALSCALELCSALEKDLQSMFLQTVDFHKLDKDVMVQSNQVAKIAGIIGTLSMNAKISAFRGSNAGTLQEIAKALGSVSTEVQSITENFLEQARSTAEVLERLAFDMSVGKLQLEVTRQFLDEIIDDDQEELDARTRECLSMIMVEVQSRTSQVFRSLEDARKSLSLLNTEVERLARNNKRLSFVQFAGQKEAVVCDSVSSFSVVFKEVRSQIAESLSCCDALFEAVHMMRHRTSVLLLRRDNVIRQLAELDRCVSDVGREMALKELALA